MNFDASGNPWGGWRPIEPSIYGEGYVVVDDLQAQKPICVIKMARLLPPGSILELVGSDFMSENPRRIYQIVVYRMAATYRSEEDQHTAFAEAEAGTKPMPDLPHFLHVGVLAIDPSKGSVQNNPASP